MNWKIRIDVYTLLALCTKQTTNENLLHSTGTLLRALCDLNGKEISKRGGTCLHTTDSFCCTAEASTKL